MWSLHKGCGASSKSGQLRPLKAEGPWMNPASQQSKAMFLATSEPTSLLVLSSRAKRTTFFWPPFKTFFSLARNSVIAAAKIELANIFPRVNAR